MRIVINSKVYDLRNGIGLLKTLYENDYSAIPEELKHEQLENRWGVYEGIPKKLYTMSQSSDAETLELSIELLKKDDIKHHVRYTSTWDGNSNLIKRVSAVTIFETV